MGLKYAFFHVSVHILLIYLLYLSFNSNPLNLIVIFLGHSFIDLDHISVLRKHGIRKFFYLRTVLEFGKQRKYPLHNFYSLSISIIFVSFISSTQSFLLGLFALSILTHFLWDIFEDVVIFRMKIDHWKL